MADADEADFYYSSKLAEMDMANAEKNWKATMSVTVADVTYVEAVAGTGSRYIVVITELPRDTEDGPLVSVLSPWRTCKLFSASEVSISYVLEHFADPARDIQNLGDLMALTKTINHGLAQV